MTTFAERYAALQVPRYTSYPTAAEFSADVDAADHARWLRQRDPRESVSVYLHVPYCSEICLYCGCHSRKSNREDVIADYRAALEAEIVLTGRALSEPLRIARLHWGGGTPSILGADGLASVVNVLQANAVFETGFEHAIELDPRYVTAGLAGRLVELQVNRASLGVQDVNPRVQAAIGRIQPVRVVEAAVERLRAVGIDRLNFDLMYGLPLQTVDSLRQTCQVVADFSPSRIACYGYAHIPQRKAAQRRIDAAVLPGTAERLAQSDLIARELTARGYVKVGIDHFARPDDPLASAAVRGELHRNFQGYTDDDRTVLVGFGASAISFLPDGYTQNTTDVPGYVRAISTGQFATARGCRLAPGDRARARIIEQLLCQFEVDLASTAPGMDFSEEMQLLHPLIADGIASGQGSVIKVSEMGKPFARVVAAVFDLHSRTKADRFSVAV